MLDLPTPESLWHSDTETPDRQGQAPPHSDVLVVGAGIAGLTTACLLARAGRGVTVVESRHVGAGVTGNTTAKVTAQHGLHYAALGGERAMRYAEAQVRALDWVAQGAGSATDACGFERRDSFVYTTRADRRDDLAREAEAMQLAGLTDTELLDDLDLPFDVAAAVRLPDQAQFHPQRWLLHLAEQVEAAGGQVLEGVAVLNVHDGHNGHLLVDTATGSAAASEVRSVSAEHVVVATHYPILDRALFFTRLGQTRDLVVSGPVQGTAPRGVYLDADAGYSLRTPPGATDRLIIGGGQHAPGTRPDQERCFAELAEWAQDQVGLREVSHRWAAHDLTTPDGVPYVGRYLPGSSNLWVATGFNLWGMTNGTAAGLLLHDLITDQADPAQADLMSPSRVSADVVTGAVRDQVKAGSHLVSGLARAVTSGDDAADLADGEGRVRHVGTRAVASYRDEDGLLHEVSANCTHLGCVVQFNNAERTWDCPCHGSRFSINGNVLNGPATDPLEPFEP
ncbi:FAD-dependent oxidoreductase [Ornithinimicrobium murale]|uniref:FAD-dependent oxidoreductase n=1 Tax=Ornithinimicrobium murale TaxID=1050153 RepID=UPI000E0DDCE6|nr:FAD-dependent oxidoreductase [Ornithinimicrobium murale]